jgi:hypothetical protein
VGIRFLIRSGGVFDSGGKVFASGTILSGAGAFEVYLCGAGFLFGEVKSWGGEEGLIGELDPDVDVDDSITTGKTLSGGVNLSFAFFVSES